VPCLPWARLRARAPAWAARRAPPVVPAAPWAGAAPRVAAAPSAARAPSAAVAPRVPGGRDARPGRAPAGTRHVLVGPDAPAAARRRLVGRTAVGGDPRGRAAARGRARRWGGGGGPPT